MSFNKFVAELREFALGQLETELTFEMGLAVGAVPTMVEEGNIILLFHCKTKKAPKTVRFARAISCDSETVPCVRPSPFELMENATRLTYKGPIHTLVAVDGVQKGPVEVLPKYNLGITVPVMINEDPVGGLRVEEAFLFEVSDLSQATSVFDDGAFASVRITRTGAFVGGVEIPPNLLARWKVGDDSKDPDPKLSLTLSKEERVFHPSTPAAALIKLVSVFLRQQR